MRWSLRLIFCNRFSLILQNEIWKYTTLSFPHSKVAWCKKNPLFLLYCPQCPFITSLPPPKRATTILSLCHCTCWESQKTRTDSIQRPGTRKAFLIDRDLQQKLKKNMFVSWHLHFFRLVTPGHPLRKNLVWPKREEEQQELLQFFDLSASRR